MPPSPPSPPPAKSLITDASAVARRVVPFSRPSLGAEEEAAVLEVMRSGWLTSGERALAFEREFAAALEVPHALAVSSATAGLHLALLGCGIGPGDRVITTSYTFVATAHAIAHTGAEPVFVDVEPHTLNIDPVAVERECRRSGQIAGILPVHIAGLPCDMESLRAIAARYHAVVIEDAAHAFPVQTELGHAGALGDAGVFSFYATKTLTTGEGGMVVCHDGELATRMRELRLHGIDRPVWNRYAPGTAAAAPWQYDVAELGYKYNLSDLAAAIGRVQLRRAGELLQRRRAIATAYHSGLADCPALALPAFASEHAWHLYIIRLRLDRLRLDRDTFVQHLAERGVHASVHFRPLHTTSYYRRRCGLSADALPLTLAAAQQAVSLPLYPDMSTADVEHVIGEVRGVLAAAVA